MNATVADTGGKSDFADLLYEHVRYAQTAAHMLFDLNCRDDEVPEGDDANDPSGRT